MADENKEELPVAYRRLQRRPDGRMGVYYVDIYGNLIPYGNLGNYSINEVIGSSSIPGTEPGEEDDEEDKEEEEKTEPDLSYLYESSADEQDRDSARVGEWDDPYTGPGEFQIGYDIADKIGGWLSGSKAFQAVETFGNKVAVPATEKISEFLKDQEKQRQDLQKQGITTAEEVQGIPQEPIDEVTSSPLGPMATAPTVNPHPEAIYDSGPKGVTTTSFNQGLPGVDEEFMPGPGVSYQDLGTLETYTGPGSIFGGSSFIDAALSAPPGPDGGINPDLQTQLDIGMTPGQVRDQQLAEQEFMKDQEQSQVAAGMGALQDMGSIPDVTEVGVVTGQAGIRDVNAHTANITPEVEEAIIDLANDLGLAPAEVAGIIGAETANTFSPSIDNGLGYAGSIQFGQSEQALYSDKYGKDITTMSFSEQLQGPVRDFLADRGFTKGMSAKEMYTTIHAGSPHVGMQRKDFKTGLTTAQTYDKFIEPRIRSAAKFFGSTVARAPTPNVKGPTYDPYSPEPASQFGAGYGPLGGFSGGRLSSDPELGGYSTAHAVDPTMVSQNTGLGFTSPMMSGPSRSVTTSTVTGFSGGQTFGSFGPSTTSFGSNRPATQPGLATNPFDSPQSAGTPASTTDRDNPGVGTGSKDVADSSGGSAGGDSGPGSATETGEGQSGGSGGGQAGSTGNTEHGTEQEMQSANDAGIGDLGGWF